MQWLQSYPTPCKKFLLHVEQATAGIAADVDGKIGLLKKRKLDSSNKVSLH